MKLSFKDKILYGSVLLGIGFPIMGIIISISSLDLSFTIENIILAHKKVPANFLIDLAPIVLPTVAFLVIKLAEKETEKAVEEDEKTKLNSVGRIIRELSRNNYEVDCTMDGVLENLGNELGQLKEALLKNKKLEEERIWESSGFAKFAGILRDNSSDITALGVKTITELVKYVGANFGGFYFLDDERKTSVLRLIGSYAFDAKFDNNKTFEIGEGPIGQCFKDGEYQYFEDVPNSYQFNIESGLGSSPPKSILYVPLIANDVSVGVMEISSLNAMDKFKIEFVQKLCESIAISMLNVKNSQKTQDLLEESQFMGQQLQAQEEELRQNAEELQATQEEIERKLSETESILNSERKKINAIIDTSLDGIIVVSQDGKLKEFNPAFQELFGYTKSELKKLSLNDILNFEEPVLQYLESGVGKVREMEVTSKKGDNIWTKASVNKIEIDGDLSYSMFISDISELKHSAATMEESLMEFQNMMMEQSEMQANLEEELESLKKELEKGKGK